MGDWAQGTTIRARSLSIGLDDAQKIAAIAVTYDVVGPSGNVLVSKNDLWNPTTAKASEYMDNAQKAVDRMVQDIVKKEEASGKAAPTPDPTQPTSPQNATAASAPAAAPPATP